MYVIESELRQQFDALARTVQALTDQQGEAKEALDGIRTLCVLGCGSSFSLAKSAATLFSQHTGVPAYALPAGDVLVNFASYKKLLAGCWATGSRRPGGSGPARRRRGMAFPSTSTQWGSRLDAERRTGWGSGCRDSPGRLSRRPSSGRRCGWRPSRRGRGGAGRAGGAGGGGPPLPAGGGGAAAPQQRRPGRRQTGGHPLSEPGAVPAGGPAVPHHPGQSGGALSPAAPGGRLNPTGQRAARRRCDSLRRV